MTQQLATVGEATRDLGRHLSQRAADFFETEADARRFISVATRAIAETPDLVECDQGSLFRAFEACASDGLRPDGREAAIVIHRTWDPKARAKVALATYMPMYFGMLKKLYATGALVEFSVELVYEGDEFRAYAGDSPRYEHAQTISARGEVVAGYAIASLKTGGKVRTLMSREDLDRIMDATRRKDNKTGEMVLPKVWQDHPDEMRKKTVIRRIAKLLPLPSEFVTALMRDGAEDAIEISMACDDGLSERPSLSDPVGDPPPWEKGGDRSAEKRAADVAKADKSFIDKLFTRLREIAFSPTPEEAEETPDPLRRIENAVDRDDVDERIKKIEVRGPALYGEYLDRYSGLVKEIEAAATTQEAAE